MADESLFFDELKNQQKYAELLRQQAFTPLDTNQMAGGHVVPVSKMQGLAKILQGYMAGKEQGDMDTAQKDRAKDMANTLKQYNILKNGTPETSVADLSPRIGNNPLAPNMKVTPAVAPNPNAADELLANSTNSMIQRLNYERMVNQFKHKEAEPYTVPLSTSEGYIGFDTRGNKTSPILNANGKPYMAANASSELQGEIARQKESGKIFGKETTGAQVNLPTTVANADELIKLTQDLINHPGREAATGLSSWNPINKIRGTEANDFNIALKQIKGKQFLEAYNTLKGGGAITEVEGTKATDALSRMNTASSEEAFLKASRDFMDVVKLGRDRMIQRASQGLPQYNSPGVYPSNPPPAVATNNGMRPTNPLPASMTPRIKFLGFE